MGIEEKGKKRGRAGRMADKSAIKALVTVYGIREATRMSGLPFGTVSGWAFKYQWKRAKVGIKAGGEPKGLDAGDMLKEALEKSKEASTLNLAKFTEKASLKAAEHRRPLEIARKVKDVASVYSTLWPVEEQNGLIEGGILIGTQEVRLDSKEIEEAKVVEGRVIEEGE
jgi:hypothetical protein